MKEIICSTTLTFIDTDLILEYSHIRQLSVVITQGNVHAHLLSYRDVCFSCYIGPNGVLSTMVCILLCRHFNKICAK